MPEIRSDVIKGIKGSKLYEKNQLEELITAHGGDYCQRCKEGDDVIPVSSTEKGESSENRLASCVADYSMTVPGVNAPKKFDITIVKPEYIIESIKRKRMLPFIQE